MSFYIQPDSYDPYQPYFLSCYPPCYAPCYPQYGYGSGTSYCDPGNCYNNGYEPYGYGSGGLNTCSTSPCSYGYRYTRRGSCYEPWSYRLGYGARRNFPSRSFHNP
ncbi:KAP6-1: Keratin glycine/tyrosine-rich of hair [Crotalus adamanteus]|uniref:KAP6-1: Keratin glycine/tyrosine-rich of hair n=1 Tax=Crotalus adamanteus TaxID=8729 RepID=A0AAW1AMC4_CROAD